METLSFYQSGNDSRNGMGVVSILTAPLRYALYLLLLWIHFWLWVIQTATSIAMVLMNAALSLLILIEELAVVVLVLPWIPTHRIGEVFYFLRRWGIPGNLTFALYFTFGVIFVFLNIIGLELSYLQVNEELQNCFDEFRTNLFTSLKLFVIIHRFLNLLSNQASLKSTCRTLQQHLKEKGEKFVVEDDDDHLMEDPEMDKLREELKRTKEELQIATATVHRLQQQQPQLSHHELM